MITKKTLYRSMTVFMVTASVIITCSACADTPAADPAEEPNAEKTLTETAARQMNPRF